MIPSSLVATAGICGLLLGPPAGPGALFEGGSEPLEIPPGPGGGEAAAPAEVPEPSEPPSSSVDGPSEPSPAEPGVVAEVQVGAGAEPRADDEAESTTEAICARLLSGDANADDEPDDLNENGVSDIDELWQEIFGSSAPQPGGGGSGGGDGGPIAGLPPVGGTS